MQELAPERHAVREAIESLHLTPVMFELGARPYPPRALYRAYLEQSDVFVGLYWESYGWVAPVEEVSGLEDEYRLSGDRPKLIYIKAPAPNRQPRLTELIARIQGADVSYRPFGSADELRTLVADDLAVLLTERFAASVEAAVEPRSRPIAPLPRPTTRLIGRDTDVAQVLDLLVDSDVRMVSIVGPGGIGSHGWRWRWPRVRSSGTQTGLCMSSWLHSVSPHSYCPPSRKRLASRSPVRAPTCCSATSWQRPGC